MQTKHLLSLMMAATLVAGLSGCAELKQTGKEVGHATKEATTAIGHGSRDAVKAVGHTSKKVIQDIKES
ncbi:hypothetical protein [Paraferrimonas haliotis]|uniref:Lipoprotein n=1 Tax=Paraferrimonas haliotis TaxID=2013866 RepID=A0AA37WX35_9GAMM|nr:hypothetical protein [Paraferrimonas haliotis]GLS82954.1 hypothetical protein GCM10007894_09310 [Paraferrimonas haliotis]